MSADVLAVWEAWRAYHPSAKGAPSKAAEREIRAALGDADAEALVCVVDWAHLAPSPRASFLRGAAYESGESSVGAYLGVENLMRRTTLETRIGWAREWAAQGRPDYRDAAPAPAKAGELSPRDARMLSAMRHLLAVGDATGHDDPAYLDRVHRVWVSCPTTAGPTALRSTPAAFLDRELVGEIARIRAWIGRPSQEVTDGR